jgi:hypothetical protein
MDVMFTSGPTTTLSPGHDHIGVMAPANRTDEPFRPIDNGCLWAVSPCHFGGLRFNLMAAFPAPYDQAHMCSRRIRKVIGGPE